MLLPPLPSSLRADADEATLVALAAAGSTRRLSEHSAHTPSPHHSHNARRRNRLNERRHSLQKPGAAEGAVERREAAEDEEAAATEVVVEATEGDLASLDDQSLPMKVE